MSSKDIKRVIKALEEYRTNLLRELDALENVIECSLKNYDFMIDFAIQKGFKRVVDIGCAFGQQAELCKNRIKYIGINEDELNFYSPKPKHVTYSAEKYPYYIPFDLYKNDIAISNLAIGWNCYVDEKETEKQFEAISNDFKACLLYLTVERGNLLNKYFKHIEEFKKEQNRKLLPTAFYYCYN